MERFNETSIVGKQLLAIILKISHEKGEDEENINDGLYSSGKKGDS